MRRVAITLAAGVALAAPAAMAEGFAVDDLGTLPVNVSAFPGGTYDYAATAPDRLTIVCEDCEVLVGIDIQLGRQTDGTEGRVRSGETAIADLVALCRASNPTCRIDALDIAPAVGWVSRYKGGISGSTAVILLDGDMLTIRSVAADVEIAARNSAIAFDQFARSIVGAE
jgi:hypothetical protein